MRESIIFYNSFLQSVKLLPEEYRLKALMAILEYALEDKMPSQEEDLSLIPFTIAKPQIDANNERYENGKKGGRPKKDKNEKPLVIENENHRLLKEETIGCENKKPNYNVNDNYNVNYNVNDDDNIDIPLKVFLDRYPSVMVDINSPTQTTIVDWDVMLNKFNESEYLRLNCNSLNWVIRNFRSILTDKYKDKSKVEDKTTKPQVDGSLYKIL